MPRELKNEALVRSRDVIGDRSEAFHRETLCALALVKQIRSPSKAAWNAPLSPLPDNYTPKRSQGFISRSFKQNLSEI
jgi:hypothetical protein